MKHLFIAAMVAAISLSACSENQNNKGTDESHSQTEGTHQHEDGSVHEDHTSDTSSQEEFSVTTDTLKTEQPTNAVHTHEGSEQPHAH